MQNGVEPDESQELEKGTDSNGATTSNFDNTVVTQAKIPANIWEFKCVQKHWSWNAQNTFGIITTICSLFNDQISINIKHAKEDFIGCEDCGAKL